MTQGVIYYNKGVKCITRLLVSMHTLRKHYQGEIHVLVEGEQPNWFKQATKDLNAQMIQIIPKEDVPPLVRKAQLHEFSLFDITMFIDADTIILQPIDDYFDKIKEYGFCTGEFAGWSSKGKIGRRINGFNGVCTKQEVNEAKKYGKATNTGIFGFTKDSEFLEPWKQITIAGWKNECSKIPDEVGCQMLLPKYKHWLAPVEWGVSVKHGEAPAIENIKIIHYHGRKHAEHYPFCSIWKQSYWDYFWTKATEEVKQEITQKHGDRRLARYLKTISKDVTVITALDNKYYDKFKSNYPKWMKTQGLMEIKFIVFVSGIALDDTKLDFMRDRVTLINWDKEAPVVDSQRSKMLHVFTHGASKYVKTKWCIKLDGDVTPENKIDFGYVFEYPKGWHKNVITAHKWGYTKPGKWLIALEKWCINKIGLEDTSPVFPSNEYPKMEKQKRYGHPRIASFIAIQRTDFIKKAVSLCGNTMPVPSHDTYLWYLAKRLNKKILRTNWKKQGFKP